MGVLRDKFGDIVLNAMREMEENSIQKNERGDALREKLKENHMAYSIKSVADYLDEDEIVIGTILITLQADGKVKKIYDEDGVMYFKRIGE